MIIDERITQDGTFERVRLELVDKQLVLVEPSGQRSHVPVSVVLAVVRRYGRPLDDSVPVTEAGLVLAPGVELCSLRHRALVDAGVRDYAVLCVADDPPLAVMATMFTRALCHLVRASQSSRAV